MKTLHKNQTRSMTPNAAPNLKEKKQGPTTVKDEGTLDGTMNMVHSRWSERIADDDGISNSSMNALIVLLTLITVIASIGSGIGQEGLKYHIIRCQTMFDTDQVQCDNEALETLDVRAETDANANLIDKLGISWLLKEGSEIQAVFYLNLVVPYGFSEYGAWDVGDKNALYRAMRNLAITDKVTDFNREAEFNLEFLTSVEPPGKSEIMTGNQS